MKYDITIDIPGEGSQQINNCPAELATSMIQQMFELHHYQIKFNKQNFYDLVSRPEKVNKIVKHFLATRQLIVRPHRNYMITDITLKIINEALKEME
jgi:hypothetical protein